MLIADYHLPPHSSDGFLIVVDGDGNRVCEFTGEREDDMQNAQLFAAASELLAEHYCTVSVLGNVVTRLQRDGASPAIISVLQARIASCTAVIAQATGEAVQP